MILKEFDYQWGNLPDKSIEFNKNRIKELLEFTKINRYFFKNKLCLDAGCGNGRYTYALLELGAKVHSVDISLEAIKICRRINPNSCHGDIMKLRNNPIYDFVLCYGVLHHLPEPYVGFKKIVSQVKQNGVLHIMVYNKNTQKVYKEGRKIWYNLTEKEKRDYCIKMIKRHGGNMHGWWDAFNPKYNFSYSPNEIKKWFKRNEFIKIKVIKKRNINIRGVRNFI